jgi:hypothetical protein
VDPLILAGSLFGLAAVCFYRLRKTDKIAGPETQVPAEGLQDLVQPQGPFVGTLVIGLDLHVLGCNDAFCKFFSISPKEVVGRRITTLFRKSLSARIEEPGQLEANLAQGPVSGNQSPLEVNLSVSHCSEPLRLLHTTALFEGGNLEGIRIEYFVDVTGLGQNKPAFTAKTNLPSRPAMASPIYGVFSAAQVRIVHIDKHLCPTALSPGALALLGEGVAERHLLGHPLSSTAGWLGDPTLVAEIRKTLRGGGTAQVRRQPELGGPWVDVLIAPSVDGVSLTLETRPEVLPHSLQPGRPEKQRDLFSSLSSGRQATPTRKARIVSRRRKPRPSSNQTEFLFQPPSAHH